MTSLILLILVILAGIANAVYLYWQYRQRQLVGRAMVCPLGGKCEEVVGSRFGTTLGVKNELTGIAYYVALLVALGTFFAFPALRELLMYGIVAASLVSVLFSTYLFFAQILVLKEYCSWCIFATVINYAIFALELVYFDFL